MNQDLLALIIAEIDHAGLPFWRKRAWLREPVDDPLNGENSALLGPIEEPWDNQQNGQGWSRRGRTLHHS